MTDFEFWKNEQQFKQRKENQAKINAESAKQRIRKKATISVQTCGVGALADFEHFFGHLWQHGEKYENLNPQEKKMRDMWNEVRDSILDRAENSKRLLLREIDRCEFKEYEPHKYITILRNKEQRNGRD